MGFDRLRDSALKQIKELLPLDQPISSLDAGRWDQDLSLGDDIESDVADLAAVKLSGGLSAEVHLTRRGEPPATLDTFDPDPDESRHAIASLVLAAEAGAELKAQTTIGSGADITVGPEAAASLTLAQHRRYPASQTGLSALTDLLRNLRDPYARQSLETLAEHELFHVELSGTGSLAATAGWEWGLVRTLDGGEIDRLNPGDLAGVRAGAKAGVTVRLGVEGKLRILIDRSPRDPKRRVRARLFRRRGQFVGAGLTVSGGVRLTQAGRFVDSIVSRLLQVPEDFVSRLLELRSELREARELAAGLTQETQQTLADTAGTDTLDHSLDAWMRSRQILDQLPTAGDGALALLRTSLDTVKERIAELDDELARFVDDSFVASTAPLSTIESRIDQWLDAYRKAREKAVELIVGRARQGIEAELAAGINRTRAREALLELDFELDSASALLIEAMKGNFTPAIERARTPGATGVELLSGTLKQTIQRDRFYNLRLNLLGFVTKVDFQRFNQIEFATDLAPGSLTISGKSGASLSGEHRGRLNELGFLFDVYGALERSGDEVFTTAGAQFRATLTRSGEIRREPRIHDTVPRHLEGLRRLGVLDQERASQLREILLADSPEAYAYELELAFPPSSIPRMFSLDVEATDAQLRARLWQWMRQAVEILDLPVSHPRGVVPLSSFFQDATIRAVEHRPVASGWTAIDDIRGPDGRRFQEGAYRMAWAYLLNARTFVAAYVKSRASLLSGQRLRQVLATLESLSAKTVKGAGSFTTRPFDAKYLVFALAEGLKEVELSMTLRRGDVAIRL